MKLFYKLVLVLVLLWPLNSHALETKIPDNSTYMAIKADHQVHQIIKTVLVNSYSMMLYPPGSDLLKSPLYSFINILKKQKTQYIEFFTNPEWGILLKLDITNFNDITNAFMNILQEEGFMPELSKTNATNVKIISKSPVFQGNSLFFLREQNKVLISNNENALRAWKTRGTSLENVKEIQSLLNDKKGSPLFFSYENQYSLLSQDSNAPYFVAVYYSPKTPKLVEAKTLFSSTSDEVFIPNFIPKNPLFLTTASPLQFSKVSSQFPLEVARTISQITVRNMAGLDHIYTVLNNGDIFSFNEGKYDLIDAYVVLQSKQNGETLLENQIKSLPAVNASKLNGYNLYKIIPRNRKDMPISALMHGRNLIFSYNIKTLTEISKTTPSDSKRPLELYANITELINKFPIMSSLAAQYALNVKNIKSISGFQTINLTRQLKTQSFSLVLN